MDDFTPRQRMRIKKDLHDETAQRLSVIDDKNYDRIIKTTNKNIIVKKKGDLTIGDIDPFEK